MSSPDPDPDTEGTATQPTAEAIAPAASLDAVAAVATPPAAPDLTPAACAARLSELFPALFRNDGPPKPLKLRIQADIQQRAPGIFTRRVLSFFLSRYTTTSAYLKGLVYAPHRFDLDGQPAGEIAAEHRQAATDELARRKQIFDARRAAERDARRAAEKQARQEHEAQQQVRQADDHARRERVMLLRAFETSTLTKANFCALKGIAPTDLDAQLEHARRERAEHPPELPRSGSPRGPRPPR